jgi:hypothetical protein
MDGNVMVVEEGRKCSVYTHILRTIIIDLTISYVYFKPRSRRIADIVLYKTKEQLNKASQAFII